MTTGDGDGGCKSLERAGRRKSAAVAKSKTSFIAAAAPLAMATCGGMAVVLITGNPGSGKTTITRELTRLGQAALDADEIAHHETTAGGRADSVAEPTSEWLAAHRWVWGRLQLQAAIAEYRPPTGHLFVCGIAMDLQELLDLFDVTVLLSLDAATQLNRLDAPSNAHRNAAQRQEIVAGLPVFEQQMRSLGAVVVDARLPTPTVAERVLQLVDGLSGEVVSC